MLLSRTPLPSYRIIETFLIIFLKVISLELRISIQVNTVVNLANQVEKLFFLMTNQKHDN